jgi:hypothetical protein
VPKDFLLVIADREPLAWILTEQRMAFPSGRTQLASRLAEGDRLFLYATRNCFHNAVRDRGRLIGEAVVASTVMPLREPIVFGDKAFPVGCELHLIGLVARDTGPELRGMVGRLHLFPDPRTWSAHLRRVLVPLDPHDAAIVRSELAPLVGEPQIHRGGYLESARSARA